MKIIFDKSMQDVVFPDNMRVAVVKPIHKGKSKTEIVNYYPVSLYYHAANTGHNKNILKTFFFG